jgi:serine protease
LSYGGSGACDNLYQTTVNEVRQAGALLVVAAGNEGGPLTRPADCAGVMAVTAVQGDGAKASYANFGPQVALAAPGGSGLYGADDAGLLTTLDRGRQGPVGPTYSVVEGTSFAAPLAAGVASLVLGIQPGLDVSQLESLLKGAVRPHTTKAWLPTCSATAATQGVCNCTPQTCGAGLLDADLAIRAAQALGAMPGSGGAGTTPGNGTTPNGGTTTGSGATSGGSSPSPDTGGGGGGTSWAWGLALWVWVLAAARAGRRRAWRQG